MTITHSALHGAVASMTVSDCSWRHYTRLWPFGAFYAERRPERPGPWFERWTEDGEFFFFIGRIYLILTPWSAIKRSLGR
jgi:hypothetical protein